MTYKDLLQDLETEFDINSVEEVEIIELTEEMIEELANLD